MLLLLKLCLSQKYLYINKNVFLLFRTLELQKENTPMSRTLQKKYVQPLLVDYKYSTHDFILFCNKKLHKFFAGELANADTIWPKYPATESLPNSAEKQSLPSVVPRADLAKKINDSVTS